MRFGVQGPRSARQPVNSGCLSRWPYISTLGCCAVPTATSWRVAATSKNSTGVRRRPAASCSCTISSVRPGTRRAFTQSAARRTTVSRCPCAAQSASNIGLLAGIAM